MYGPIFSQHIPCNFSILHQWQFLISGISKPGGPVNHFLSDLYPLSCPALGGPTSRGSLRYTSPPTTTTLSVIPQGRSRGLTRNNTWCDIFFVVSLGIKTCFDKYGSEYTREGARMQVLWPVLEQVISLQTPCAKTHRRKAVFVPVL